MHDSADCTTTQTCSDAADVPEHSSRFSLCTYGVALNML